MDHCLYLPSFFTVCACGIRSLSLGCIDEKSVWIFYENQQASMMTKSGLGTQVSNTMRCVMLMVFDSIHWFGKYTV